VDEHGWEYALDFPRKFYGARTWLSNVRRRRWIRVRRVKERQTQAEESKQIRKQEETKVWLALLCFCLLLFVVASSLFGSLLCSSPHLLVSGSLLHFLPQLVSLSLSLSLSGKPWRAL